MWHSFTFCCLYWRSPHTCVDMDILRITLFMIKESNKTLNLSMLFFGSLSILKVTIALHALAVFSQKLRTDDLFMYRTFFFFNLSTLVTAKNFHSNWFLIEVWVFYLILCGNGCALCRSRLIIIMLFWGIFLIISNHCRVWNLVWQHQHPTEQNDNICKTGMFCRLVIRPRFVQQPRS